MRKRTGEDDPIGLDRQLGQPLFDLVALLVGHSRACDAEPTEPAVGLFDGHVRPGVTGDFDHLDRDLCGSQHLGQLTALRSAQGHERSHGHLVHGEDLGDVDALSAGFERAPLHLASPPGGEGLDDEGVVKAGVEREGEDHGVSACAARSCLAPRRDGTRHLPEERWRVPWTARSLLRAARTRGSPGRGRPAWPGP